MPHIKKLSIAILVVGFLLGPAIPSRAETSPASSQALITTLQAQIADLQNKIEALKQAQNAVMTASSQVAATAKILRHLREGMSGDDVKTLQAILAKYPDIYPEGLITGFYGRATARAVKRFQEHEHVEAVGSVGPKTLAKLLKELEKDPIGHEEDKKKDKGIKRPCAMVPPGHLIASGWLRKHDGVSPIVPLCQKLPPGIENLLKDGMGTTTPDTTAPVISGLTAGSITTVSAHITWTTDEKATGRVFYATSPIAAGAATALSPVSSTEFVKDHDLLLSGLSAGTTYYYYVQSSDKAGNTATSSQLTFKTSSDADVTPPVISAVMATSISGSGAHITWATDQLSDSTVWYSTSTPITTTANASAVSSATLVLSHDLALSGLATSTQYYYIAGSKDAAGNSAASAQYSLTTNP